MVSKQWLTQDVQLQYQQKLWDYYNISPVKRQQMINQSMLFYYNALDSLWRGKITKKDFQFYERNFALRQFMANTDRIGANAASTQASAYSRNVDNQDKVFKAQARDLNASAFTKEMHNDAANDWITAFQYNPKTNKYDIPYRDKAYRYGYQLSLSQNRIVLNNMLEYPELVQSIKFSNYANGGTSVGRLVGDVVDQAADAMTFGNQNEVTHTYSPDRH